MKKIAITLGTLLAVAASSALAQDNSDRNYPFDPDAVARQQWLESQGYYPRHGYAYSEPRWGDRSDMGVNDVPAWGDWRRYGRFDRPTECWNPRAGHFEEVRPGEFQDDLDFSRCRALRYWR